ncbi:MAG TPA: hypothetical protein VL463_19995 [Kofleriaceae bacterium]|nr:hypothetical protein [Kofleriaceae bacterium]
MRSLAIALVLFTATSARADEKSSSDDQTEWGLGVKVRRSFAPKPVQKLFVDDTPGYAYDDGAGFDFAKRNKDLEVVFGFGYDRLDGVDGYYLEKGGDPLEPGKVTYVHFDHLRWYTAEFTVIDHLKLHKFLEFRYGAGLGIGLVQGQVLETDALCVGSDLQSDCIMDPAGAKQNQPADIPPVLPVINVLVGFQLEPTRWLHIHLDGGIHTAPYVSLGATLYLW